MLKSWTVTDVTVSVLSTESLTGVYGMSARHQGRPAGRADGVDVVVVEDDPTVGEAVNVGCGDLVRPVETNVIPTLQTNSVSRTF